MRKLLIGLVFIVSVAIVASPPPIFGQTATDEFDACIEGAVDAAVRRAANDEGSVYSRFVSWTVDVAVCTAEWLSPLN